jgi:formamidopyrimidine-DNA glycosylase
MPAMPELPEVEVLRRSLERLLPGRRIEQVDVRSAGLREPFDAAALAGLAGQRIAGLRRRAKYLFVDFEAEREDGGSTLVVHLGMSGRFTLAPAEEPAAKHEHLAFQLDNGQRLRLVDPRRFGLAFVAPTATLDADPHLAGLGIEPADAGFHGHFFQQRAGRRKGPVKPFLMDGQIVVGVGNIYACEALWRARVHPERSVATLKKRTWQTLADSVRAVLDQAIAEGGTTLNDFADGEGNAGYFQVSLAVYDREGEPCPRCAKPIERLVQANRSTFFCPRCQR